jgi:hypothetical protein
MTLALEYDQAVKSSGQRAIPALLALFGVLFIPVLFVSLASAQFSSASASSGGGGGHGSSGGGGGASFSHGGGSGQSTAGVSFSGHTSSSRTSHWGNSVNGFTEHHHRNANGGAFLYPYVYPYVYAVPYADPNDPDSQNADSQNDDADDDSNYQGGPTIFDRRGSGRDSYIPPTYEGPAHAQTQPAPDAAPQQLGDNVTTAAAGPTAEAPQPPITLVFKDGRQLEVENYAIVSQTLYDLTPGHHRRIAIADLDLPATEKQNDDRGIAFQLPPQGN